MAKRKQREIELQAALHGIPIKKTSFLKKEVKNNMKDVDKQLKMGMAKGYNIKMVKKRKK